jgi:hypothetical protein
MTSLDGTVDIFCPGAERAVSMPPADHGTAFSEDFNHQSTLYNRRSKFNVRRWNNPARVDSRAKHANLSLQQLYSCVVSRTHPLRRQDNQRMKYRVHPKSFRVVNSVGRPQNTGCEAVDTLTNALDSPRGSVYSQMYSRKW